MLFRWNWCSFAWMDEGEQPLPITQKPKKHYLNPLNQMSKAPHYTILDKLFKRKGISQNTVCKMLGITNVRMVQIKRDYFNTLNYKYICLLSVILDLKPYELIYLLHNDILTLPDVPIIDEEKLNLMLKEL